MCTKPIFKSGLIGLGIEPEFTLFLISVEPLTIWCIFLFLKPCLIILHQLLILVRAGSRATTQFYLSFGSSESL